MQFKTLSILAVGALSAMVVRAEAEPAPMPVITAAPERRDAVEKRQFESLLSAGESILSGGGDINSFVQSVLGTASGALASLASADPGLASSIEQGLSSAGIATNALSSIESAASSGLGSVTGAASSVASAASSGVGSVVSGASSGVASVTGAASSVASGASSAVSGAAGSATSAVSSGTSAGYATAGVPKVWALASALVVGGVGAGLAVML